MIEAQYRRHEHTSTTDIVTLLSRVTRSHTPLSVRVGAEAFSAQIDSVHLMQPHLLVRCRANGQILARVLASDAVHFAAQFESARLEFTVAGNKLRIQGDEGLLRVELPTQLLRFDRRAHYRGKLRPDAGASCEVGADHRSVRVFAVHDISVGGIGLSFAGAPENLLVGGVLRDCLVKLPGIESFSVDLEIRCLSEDAQREDGRFLRLGCKFLNLAPSAAEAVSRFASCCD